MKDPAFLFYPNDYLGGTMGMTFEEKGAYIELLMMQFNRGHMTPHMIGQTVGQIWDKIQDKFIRDENGLWYNERLDVEKEKRKTFTDSRKNNILGVNQYTKINGKKSGHMDGHMTSHMVNVNEDVNVNKNVSKKEGKIFVFPTIDEVKKYFSENGYSEQSAITAFNYYNVANWIDSKGRKVKNWKQKMISVWFKPENKLQQFKKEKMMP